MLSCRDVSRLVSDAMEQQLPLGQRMALRVHLWMCKACAAYEQQIVALRRLTRGYAEHSAREQRDGVPAMPPQTRQRLRDTIEQELER